MSIRETKEDTNVSHQVTYYIHEGVAEGGSGEARSVLFEAAHQLMKPWQIS